MCPLNASRETHTKDCDSNTSRLNLVLSVVTSSGTNRSHDNHNLLDYWPQLVWKKLNSSRINTAHLLFVLQNITSTWRPGRFTKWIGVIFAGSRRRSGEMKTGVEKIGCRGKDCNGDDRDCALCDTIYKSRKLDMSDTSGLHNQQRLWDIYPRLLRLIRFTFFKCETMTFYRRLGRSPL